MELNKTIIKKLLFLVGFGVVLLVGLLNLDRVLTFLGWLFSLITPFVLGAAIAFVINTPMRFLENLIFSPKRRYKNKRVSNIISKIKRPVSLILTLILVAAFLFVVVFLVVPEVGRTFDIIADSLPTFFTRVEQTVVDLANQYPVIAEQIQNFEMDWTQFDWEKIGKTVADFLQSSGNFVSSTFGVATSIVNGFVNFFLGFIFSIYLLLQKEKLGRQFRQLLYAYIPEQKADRTLQILTLSSTTFSKFISGQCLEAVILALLFFFSMSLFRFPYALMVSVLIGCLALIPIFGAMIGCCVGAFLILIVNPVQAFWFLALYIIIQNIEGNLIYPYVVGNSVGLPSVWVLVAVTVGGSLMGIVGMLIFIPLCSVVYAIFRETIFRRLKERKLVKQKIS